MSVFVVVKHNRGSDFPVVVGVPRSLELAKELVANDLSLIHI